MMLGISCSSNVEFRLETMFNDVLIKRLNVLLMVSEEFSQYRPDNRP